MQSTAPTTWEASNQIGQTLGHVILAQVVDSGADIDISGLEFDFVRSIRVWDVRHYSHRERGRDDDCSESYNMRLGTTRKASSTVPRTASVVTRTGRVCPMRWQRPTA